MTDRERRETESRDPAMISLQEALDRMAAEMPEMPDSFRQGWREALRAEQNGAETMDSARIPAAAYGKGRSASWRRALSIAAVAAFVLGGALLGQDAVRFERENAPAGKTVMATEVPGSMLSANSSLVTEGVIQNTEAIIQAMDADAREAPAGALDVDLGAKLMEPLSMSAATEEDAVTDETDEAEDGAEATEAEEAAAEPAGETEAPEAADAEAMGETAAENAEETAPENMADAETPEKDAEAGTDAAKSRSSEFRPLRTVGICLILCSLALVAVLYSKKREKDNAPS